MKREDNDELTAAYLAGCYDTRKAYEQRLAEAEAKIPRWIPVGESMPTIAEPYVEYGEWVLGKERYYKAPTICCRTWIDKEQNYWEWTAENGEVIDVTHWMPLREVSESGKGE